MGQFKHILSGSALSPKYFGAFLYINLESDCRRRVLDIDCVTVLLIAFHLVSLVNYIRAVPFSFYYGKNARLLVL